MSDVAIRNMIHPIWRHGCISNRSVYEQKAITDVPRLSGHIESQTVVALPPDDVPSTIQHGDSGSERSGGTLIDTRDSYHFHRLYNQENIELNCEASPSVGGRSIQRGGGTAV